MGLGPYDEHANPEEDYGFLIDLLNMLACLTRVPISLKIENEIISSERRWPNYCKYIKKLDSSVCKKNLMARKIFTCVMQGYAAILFLFLLQIRSLDLLL